MATFDFVEAATGGYKFLWHERDNVLRLGVPLFLIKLISYSLLTAFDLGDNVLRQGLFLLPSYFVEGWMLAHLIRLAAFGERWPLKLSGDVEKDRAMILSRSRNLMAGILIYVLIKLFLSAATGLMSLAQPDKAVENVPDPTLQTFALGMIVLMLMIWLFRLVWLYIPATMGVRMFDFMRQIRGYTTSIYMLGTWLICLLPPMLLFLVYTKVIVSLALSSGADVTSPPVLLSFALLAGRAAAEILIVVIATIGMTFGIREILYGAPKKNSAR